jgi:Domain of unknown function (DUF4956)
MFELFDSALTAFPKDADLDPELIGCRLAASFVYGCVVAGVYRLTHGKPRGQSTGLLATLVLLTVLICMVTLVINNSIARSLSLVGSLAIVRFRTVVEDTRDTAFVIFAVSVGMALGAGYWKIPLMGIPFAALAAVLFRRRSFESAAQSLDFNLTIRIGVGHDPETLLGERFAKQKSRPRLVGMATARQGAAFDLTYAVCLPRVDAAMALVTELSGVAGVQSVELRQM